MAKETHSDHTSILDVGLQCSRILQIWNRRDNVAVIYADCTRLVSSVATPLHGRAHQVPTTFLPDRRRRTSLDELEVVVILLGEPSEGWQRDDSRVVESENECDGRRLEQTNGAECGNQQRQHVGRCRASPHLDMALPTEKPEICETDSWLHCLSHMRSSFQRKADHMPLLPSTMCTLNTRVATNGLTEFRRILGKTTPKQSHGLPPSNVLPNPTRLADSISSSPVIASFTALAN